MNARFFIDQIKNSNHTVRIKLLGDSITHGFGGTGFAQSGDVITRHFRQNPDGYCWANLFRDYMEKNYNCKVINHGCNGAKIEFILSDFDTLVSKDDDVILCTIGTNNRHQYFQDGEKRTCEEQKQRFYENILALAEKFREINIPFIFIANIPSSERDEQDGPNYWRIIHMNDVNELYKKAAEVCHFPLISLYDAFTEYCEKEQIKVDSLLADGLHPNDEGYRVMFELLLRELGLS